MTKSGKGDPAVHLRPTRVNQDFEMGMFTRITSSAKLHRGYAQKCSWLKELHHIRPCHLPIISFETTNQCLVFLPLIGGRKRLHVGLKTVQLSSVRLTWKNITENGHRRYVFREYHKWHEAKSKFL